MLMTSTLKRHLPGLALGLLTVAASHSSRAEMSYYVNQTSSADISARDVDFATASIPTSTSGVTNGLKIFRLQLATNNSQTQCLELWTSGDGTGDTRFWVFNDSTGDYQSLNDDIDYANGNLYSRARVWLAPPSCAPNTSCYEYADVFVTGYSSSYNAMKFSLNITKYASATSETACTQGSTLDHKQGVQTLVNPS
jgi:hypothetical protein